MKKVLALVMVIVMAFAVCACGGSGSPATIVDNDGNTVQMTAEELVSIYEENEANYKKIIKEQKLQSRELLKRLMHQWKLLGYIINRYTKYIYRKGGRLQLFKNSMMRWLIYPKAIRLKSHQPCNFVQ